MISQIFSTKTELISHLNTSYSHPPHSRNTLKHKVFPKKMEVCENGFFEKLSTPTTPSGSFRLHGKSVHLTYSKHLEIDDFLVWVNEKIQLEKWSCVNEISEDGYKHCHILLCAKKIETTNSKFFDYKGLHPNIKRVSTKIHTNNIVIYHRKNGTPITNIEIEEEKSIARKVWNCESLQDALESCASNASQVTGIISLWTNRKKIRSDPENVEWRDWQLAFFNELTENQPDDRHVIWLWDEIGGCGKTFYSNYMTDNYGAVSTTIADMYHLATILQKTLVENPEGCIPIVIFDIPRSKQSIIHGDNLYECIENIKDGRITVTKYKSEVIRFKPPYVIVFANFEPEYERLSLDRWDIRKLIHDKDITQVWKINPKTKEEIRIDISDEKKK